MGFIDGCCLGSVMTFISIIGIYFTLDWYCQVEYPVHKAPGFVVVTGASSGIGYSTAEDLAKLGYTVFAGFRKDQDGEKLKTIHANILPLRLDVTNAKDIKNAVTVVTDALEQSPEKPFVGLVNNAGVLFGTPIGATAAWKTKAMYDVNVLGTINLSNAFLPLIIKQKSRIVNIGSILGFCWGTTTGGYISTKWALRGYSNALRSELLKAQVSVSLVEPGLIRTKMIDKSVASSKAFDLSALDPVLQTLYESTMEMTILLNSLWEVPEFADPPKICTDVIADALMNKYPKDVYTVGQAFGTSGSAMRVLYTLLPPRVLDAINHYADEVLLPAKIAEYQEKLTMAQKMDL